MIIDEVFATANAVFDRFWMPSLAPGLRSPDHFHDYDTDDKSRSMAPPTARPFQPGRTSFNWQPLKDPHLFERLCAFIFQRRWDDPNFNFVAARGKSQAGLDIVGINAKDQKLTGVQCKNYTKI